MLQRLDQIVGSKARQPWLPDGYVAGWATADPAKIAEAVAPGYHFHDPLVGIFSRRSMHEYFELLQTKFARAGAIRRQDVAFFLQGPLTGRSGKLQFWREAPGVGLIGVAQIEVGPRGVIAERVAYDLNIASDLLWRALNGNGS